MANILVCDDDKAIVEAIEIYLTQEGYHILKAYDGQEALDIIKSKHVDLVLTDIVMPFMDGLELSEILSREFPDIHVVILTAVSYTHLTLPTKA